MRLGPRLQLASVVLNAVLLVLAGAWATRRAVEARRPLAWEVLGRAKLDQHRALAAQGARARVVLVGSSSIERGEWWELLGEPVANRGIGGDRIAGVRARLDTVAALAPERVLVAVGMNDLLAGAAPAEVARELGALAQAARAAMPGARVVVGGLPPVTGDYGGFAEAVRSANALARPEVERAGAGWLDPGPALAAPDGRLDARFSADGLHLTGAGYAAWAGLIRRELLGG